MEREVYEAPTGAAGSGSRTAFRSCQITVLNRGGGESGQKRENRALVSGICGCHRRVNHKSFYHVDLSPRRPFTRSTQGSRNPSPQTADLLSSPLLTPSTRSQKVPSEDTALPQGTGNPISPEARQDGPMEFRG